MNISKLALPAILLLLISTIFISCGRDDSWVRVDFDLKFKMAYELLTRNFCNVNSEALATMTEVAKFRDSLDPDSTTRRFLDMHLTQTRKGFVVCDVWLDPAYGRSLSDYAFD